MLSLARWISPLALERVRFITALTTTILAIAFVAIVVCVP
jgi:hypothetical protein